MEIKDLLIKIGDFKFDVNEWGSCQYSGALSMYKAYFKLRETHTKIEIREFLEFEFDYHIEFSSIYNDDEAKINYFNLCKKRYDYPLENIDDSENLIKLEKEEYTKGHLFYSKQIRLIRRSTCAEDLFFCGRATASSLWYTAPIVAESYFKDLIINNLLDITQTGLEIGPVGNMSAQSSNVKTGLSCALLVDYDIIKNTRVFDSFDT